MDNKLNLRIKKVRIEHGYKSQQSLADALQVDRSLVKSWESETRPVLPRLDNLLAMCKLFNCDLDYLVGNIEEPTHDIAFIHSVTGLSTAAIKKLQTYKHGSAEIIMISKIIEHDDLDYLLNRINQLIFKNTRAEVKKYHDALQEMNKNEINRKWLPFTMFEDMFPVIDEVLKVGDENSIESIIRFQITDKILSMIDDILQGKVGGHYE